MNSISVQNVNDDAVRRLIDAAQEKAASIGMPCTIAICDAGGNLKGLSRMDGAALLSLQVAQDKAYTAVGFGISTHEFYEFIKDDAPLSAGAPAGIDRLVVFGGGYPIKVGDSVVGGLGVSGGHWSQDMEVAEAALATLVD
jgi:uncharacterized protein GlcG (DUF336 family)